MEWEECWQKLNIHVFVTLAPYYDCKIQEKHQSRGPCIWSCNVREHGGWLGSAKGSTSWGQTPPIRAIREGDGQTKALVLGPSWEYNIVILSTNIRITKVQNWTCNVQLCHVYMNLNLHQLVPKIVVVHDLWLVGSKLYVSNSQRYMHSNHVQSFYQSSVKVHSMHS